MEVLGPAEFKEIEGGGKKFRVKEICIYLGKFLGGPLFSRSPNNFNGRVKMGSIKTYTCEISGGSDEVVVTL